MNYRVFRRLVIASVLSLFLTVLLLFDAFWRDRGKVSQPVAQLVQQIADNQGKLISGTQQISSLLDLPQEEYDEVLLSNASAPETLRVERESTYSKPAENLGGLGEEHANEGRSSPLELAFYDALNYLNQNLEQESAWTQLNQLLNSPEWKALLQENRLRLKRSTESVFLFPSDIKILPRGHVPPAWFKLTALPISSGSQMHLALLPQLGNNNWEGTLQVSDKLRQFIAKNSQDLYNRATEYNKMYRFLSGTGVQRQLSLKKLYIRSKQPARMEKEDTTGKRIVNVAQTDWEVYTRDEQVLASFFFDINHYQLRWHNKTYQSLQLLQSDWNIFNDNVDTRTAGQRQEDQMREYLQKILLDKAFLLQMQQYRLHPAPLPPREDKYYEYYDLLDTQNQHVASFALQKRVGEAYLMDRDDVKIRGLKSFLTGANNLGDLFGNNSDANGGFDAKKSSKAKKNRNSSYGSDQRQKNQAAGLNQAKDWNRSTFRSREHDIEVVLLIGTHDTIADVIMLVFINKTTDTLTIISVPRDLYYRNVKINAIYSNYGPGPFMGTLSQITGLRIQKYVSMDMYAFIEMVDLIGGIDVYLEEDLIDPTYKIKQMGKWETLVMYKGQHHLDGLGALRYARSRHSSNDFERSQRQQMILNQVTEKLRSQLRQPRKILPFLQVLKKYIQTNFSTAEIARYWLEYGGYRRNFGNTISTDNVLYYTFSNYLNLTREELAEAQADENFSRGDFILLPRNGDWSLIPKYIMDLQDS